MTGAAFFCRGTPRTSQQYYIHGDIYNPAIICHRDAYVTSFPGIFVVPGQYFNINTRVTGFNVKLSTYFNTKLAIMQHHTLDLIKNVYRDSLHATCEVEWALLVTQLQVVQHHPHAGGLLQLDTPGIYARRAGEVIYMTQCQVQVVRLCTLPGYYENLPVLSSGQPRFLHPVTRILTSDSPQIPCSRVTPVLFQHTTGWIKQIKGGGGYDTAHTPTILSPTTNGSIDFSAVLSMSRGGIYTIEGLESPSFMNFPDVREKVIQDISRGVTHSSVSSSRYDFDSISDPTAYEARVKSAVGSARRKIFGFLYSFGVISSGFIGFYMAYKGIVFFVTHIVRLGSLYRVIGCSWALFACFADALTTCVIGEKLRTHFGFDKPKLGKEIEKILEVEDGENAGSAEEESKLVPSHQDAIMLQPMSQTTLGLPKPSSSNK